MKPGAYLIGFLLASTMAAEVPSPSVSTPTNPAAIRTNAPAPVAPIEASLPPGVLIKRGFRLQEVANGLLVTNPVAMAIDENERMFVLEAPPASSPTDQPPGRIRLLEDTDGNGTFDASSIFADKLADPTALICYDGGIFVAAAGQIYYLKDKLGTGRPDVWREVFKSFGDSVLGPRGRLIVTSMTWGLDNQIHVTTAGRGGDVITGSLSGQSIVLTGGNFSFDPRTLVLSVETGSAPGGMGYDDRGRKFLGGNASHVQTVLYESRYANRNPPYSLPEPLWDMAVVSGPAAQLFLLGRHDSAPATNSTKLSSVRVPLAAISGPSYFTAPRSLVVNRDNLFPLEYSGDIFLLDALQGVVHRDKILTQGVESSARRAPDEPGIEFLASRAEACQYSQMIAGPEGALYLAGMCRRPQAGGTNTGAAECQGSIQRIVPLNFHQPKVPQLGKLSVAQLVLMLRHPNAWCRDTAARLLYAKQDKAAVTPLIQTLYDPVAPPLARVHALHVLAGLPAARTNAGSAGALLEAHLLQTLTDADDRVREHAVLLTEQFIKQDGLMPGTLWAQLGQMGGDPSPRVRFQVALTLSLARNADRGQPLADLLKSADKSRVQRMAAFNALTADAGAVFGLLAADGNFRSGETSAEILPELLYVVGVKNQPAEVAKAFADLTAIPDLAMTLELAMALESGLQLADSSLVAVDPAALAALQARAMAAGLDDDAATALRLPAIRFLDFTDYANPQWLATLPLKVPVMPAALRAEAVAAVLARPESTANLMNLFEFDSISPSLLTPLQIRFLLNHPNPVLRQRALNVFRNSPYFQHAPAVENYRSSAGGGREIFAEQCVCCHASGDGVPARLSPVNLSQLAPGHLSATLAGTNPAPLADYTATIVQTQTGGTVLGWSSVQNGKSITLHTATGGKRVIGRANITGQTSLGIASLPEELETSLTDRYDANATLGYLTVLQAKSPSAGSAAFICPASSLPARQSFISPHVIAADSVLRRLNSPKPWSTLLR